MITILSASITAAQAPAGDLLLYDDMLREPPGVTAYNPATGENIELPIRDVTQTIATSGDGRIAYIQDNDVWVLDVLNAPTKPTNITQTPDETERFLSWSPDGQFLEFQVGSGPYILYTYDGNTVRASDYGDNVTRYWNEHGWYITSEDGTNSTRWFVWNGQEHIELTLPPLPSEPAWHTLQWTPDNHLFITVGYQEQEYAQPIGPTDIFYWNGNDVREVVNPSDDRTFLVGMWSHNGRLIINSSQGYFVWDGVSLTSDGVPDTSTLTPINVPARQIYDMDWMPDGRLVIVTKTLPEADISLGDTEACLNACVYVWDYDTLQLLTSRDSNSYLVDVHDSGSIVVSDFNGLFTFGFTVFNSNLQPVFQSGGPYSDSRWSADDNLAYCSRDDLLVWNGQDTTWLSSETFSRWLLAPSPRMVCSTG